MELTYQSVTLSAERVAQLQSLGQHYNIDWRYLVTQLWVETSWGTHPQALSARKDNNWAGITWGSHVTWNPEVKKTQGLARPSAEGGHYIHYESVSDFLKDWVYLLRQGGNYTVAGAKTIEDYTRGLFVVGGAKYDYAASGYEHYLNLMRQHFMAIFSQNGGENMSKALKAIQWYEDRRGKVSYSMDYRNGPNSYDCSSALYSALIYANILPANTWLGNTETLYALENKLLIPIARKDIQKGDVFVSGIKGKSLGSGGHTGMVYDKNRIIHCNYADNGISITQIDGRSGTPLYFYRIKDAGVSSVPFDAVKKHFVCSIKELRIHRDASGSAEIVDKMTTDVIKNVDRMIKAGGYVWGSYISYKGDRRYFPIQTADGSRKFGELKDGWVDVKNAPAASISQQDGKPKVLDEDYSLVIDGQKWKLVKE